LVAEGILSRQALDRRNLSGGERCAVPEPKILTGARQALAFARGELSENVVVHVPADIDVKALRRKLGMSQARFAASFGFGPDAVQSWEQGRPRPEGPARILRQVIEHDLEAGRSAVVASRRTSRPAKPAPPADLRRCSRSGVGI
jgi:putative transcriptional regulator